MKKYLLTILLAAVLALALLPITALAQDYAAGVTYDGQTAYYNSFAEAWTAAQKHVTTSDKRAVVTMYKSVSIAEGNPPPEGLFPVTVNSGEFRTLDLNGYTIDAGGDPRLSRSVMYVYGDLTLKDSGAGGKIIGGTADGGGVRIFENATLTMDGGSIERNNAGNGKGGGVYIAARGSMLLRGGSVTGNTVDSLGGGVYVEDGGSFTVSGKSVISGNTAGTADSNLYIDNYNGQTITIGAGGLETGASIGITSVKQPTANDGVSITESYIFGNKDMSRYFASDDNRFFISSNNDGGKADIRLYSRGSYAATVTAGASTQIFNTFRDAWSSAIGQSGAPVTVRLLKNVDDTSNPPPDYSLAMWPIEVKRDNNITLDLNGYNIEGNGSLQAIAVREGGALTLIDHKGTGKITNSAGVIISGGTLDMYGGSVTGNSTNKNSGVYVASGAFNMYGGSITGNTDGGGVNIGTGAFTVSGKPVISGNKDNNISANVIMSFNNGTINIGDGGLTQGASIGVTGTPAPASGRPVAITAPHNYGDLSGYFFSDNTSYMTANVKSGAQDKVVLSVKGDIAAEVSQDGKPVSKHISFASAWADATSRASTENKPVTVKLLMNVEADSNAPASWPVTVGSEAAASHIILDLNDKYIDAAGEGRAISIQNGSLTLRSGNGTQRFSNEVTNGRADNGANVYINTGCKFVMEGGRIGRGVANNCGGGVYAATGSEFILKSGDINSNSTMNYGGGVYGAAGSTIDIRGGAITDNSCIQPTVHGAGVYVVSGATLKLSGAAVIKENTLEGGEADIPSNLYLSSGVTATLTAALQAGADIGITTQEAPQKGSPVDITKEHSYGDMSGYFKQDNTTYMLLNVPAEQGRTKEQLSVKHTHDMSCDCGSGSPIVFDKAITFDNAQNILYINGVELPIINGEYCLPEGNYYLGGDVDLTVVNIPITVDATLTVNLCLNGRTIKFSNNNGAVVAKNGKLNICDCKPKGTAGGIVSTAAQAVSIRANGALSLYGGSITGGDYGVHNSSNNLTILGAPAIIGGKAGIWLDLGSLINVEGALTNALPITVMPDSRIGKMTTVVMAGTEANAIIAMDKLSFQNAAVIRFYDKILVGFRYAIPTVDGTSIYANGTALVIVRDGEGSTVYIDANRSGNVDAGERSLKQANIANAPENGADLSKYTVYGGGAADGGYNTLITMLSGEVSAIYGGGISGTISGSASVAINGGAVETVYGGGESGATVTGKRYVSVSGAPVIGSAGQGIMLSSCTDNRITISGELNGSDDGIKLAPADVKDGVVVAVAATASHADASKLAFSTEQLGYRLASNNTETGDYPKSVYIEAGENTAYTVEHYVMDTCGVYPTEATKTDNTKKGKTDSTLTLASLKDTSLEVANGITYSYGTADSDETPVTETTIKPDGTRVVKLYYVRSEHILTLAKGTGINSVGGGDTWYYDTLISIDADVKPGYTFKEWSSSDKTLLADLHEKHSDFSMPAGDVTLTANATLNQYKVEYAAAQHCSITPTSANCETEYQGTLTCDRGYALPATVTMTIGGNSFTGFDYMDKSGDITIPKGKVLGDIVISGECKPETYGIDYDLVGGTAGSPTNPTSYTIESEDITLSAPTLANSNFAGWTGTGIIAAQTVVTIPKGSTGDRRYTATWSQKQAIAIDTTAQEFIYDGGAKSFAVKPVQTGLSGFRVEYRQNGGAGAYTADAPSALGVYDVKVSRAEDATYQEFTQELLKGLVISPASILTVNVTGIEPPVSYAAPDIGASCATAGVTVGAVSWQPSDLAFASGQRYAVSVKLTAETGSVFDANVTGTINGFDAVVSSASQSEATISYQFPATESISSVLELDNSFQAHNSQGLVLTIGKGTGITLSSLEGVSLNGTPLSSPSQYTASQGSIIITLSRAFLNTLQPGTYRLRATMTDGAYTEQDIIVYAIPPKTGDSAMPFVWLGLCVLCGVGLGLLLYKRRRK